MSSQVLVLFESDEGSRSVVDCLSQAGYVVIVSRTYSAAMAIVQSQPVDLIISDVHLENGGSVFDFLSWIRKNRSTINTPFVLFSLEPTAMAQVVEHGVRIAARSLGAARYITMDTFDGRALLHEIEWLIPEVKVGSYYIGHDLDGQKISK